jgi:hypothetical protein
MELVEGAVEEHDLGGAGLGRLDEIPVVEGLPQAALLPGPAPGPLERHLAVERHEGRVPDVGMSHAAERAPRTRLGFDGEVVGVGEFHVFERRAGVGQPLLGLRQGRREPRGVGARLGDLEGRVGLVDLALRAKRRGNVLHPVQVHSPRSGGSRDEQDDDPAPHRSVGEDDPVDVSLVHPFFCGLRHK